MNVITFIKFPGINTSDLDIDSLIQELNQLCVETSKINLNNYEKECEQLYLKYKTSNPEVSKIPGMVSNRFKADIPKIKRAISRGQITSLFVKKFNKMKTDADVLLKEYDNLLKNGKVTYNAYTNTNCDKELETAIKQAVDLLKKYYKELERLEPAVISNEDECIGDGLGAHIQHVVTDDRPLIKLTPDTINDHFDGEYIFPPTDHFALKKTGDGKFCGQEFNLNKHGESFKILCFLIANRGRWVRDEDLYKMLGQRNKKRLMIQKVVKLKKDILSQTTKLSNKSDRKAKDTYLKCKSKWIINRSTKLGRMFEIEE